MRKYIQFCASLCAVALLFSASQARAQAVFWVANNGNDANTCTQTAPCATFQGVLNKGAVSQINCLTSGNYGAFTITASITIDCGTGNIGNVIVNTGDAITIDASSAATIVLRHLNLDGGMTNSAANGITTVGFPGGTLIVEDCTVHGFPSGSGILFSPSAGRGLLQVSDSGMSGNSQGITVGTASGVIASVSLSGIELSANQYGLLMIGSGIVAGTMRNSVVTASGQTGVLADASQVFFTVEESSIIANLVSGIAADTAGSIVNVGASTIGANGTGVNATHGASIVSFGNNRMSTNGSNGSFTSTAGLR
jgi:hypothetical protein